MNDLYDIAIVGSGSAGLSASIYASRYRLRNIVFGKMPGGTIADAHKICNYPGLKDITGLELGQRMHDQAKEQGGEFSFENIVDIKKERGLFKLITESGKEYFSKTVLLSTGTERNKLKLPNEDKYLGKGVSYCATCDAMFYKEKTVGVVGGSNAATMAATMLADIAKKVYIIYRGDKLRGEPAWVEDVESKDNIEVLFNTNVVGLYGEGRLEKVLLKEENKETTDLNLDGLFIEIGSRPDISLPTLLGVDLDEKQHIIVDQRQATTLEGVWAAGDCTTNSNKFQQVVTAVGEGAVAANSIYCYLKQNPSCS